MPREEWAHRAAFRPGEESLTSAIAVQAIEAQPAFGQIKPKRGKVLACLNSIWEKTCQLTIGAHKRPRATGEATETLAYRRATLHPERQSTACARPTGLKSAKIPAAPPKRSQANARQHSQEQRSIHARLPNQTTKVAQSPAGRCRLQRRLETILCERPRSTAGLPASSPVPMPCRRRRPRRPRQTLRATRSETMPR